MSPFLASLEASLRHHHTLTTTPPTLNSRHFGYQKVGHNNVLDAFV